MRRGNLLWGLILILLGGLFLLQERGVISDVLGWFGPLVIILIGCWVLWARFLPKSSTSSDNFSIDLQGASHLDLDIDHGAGSLSLKGGAPAGVAIAGSSGLSLDRSQKLDGDHLVVELKAGPTFIPFLGPDGGEWQFNLTQDAAVAIKIDSGASSLNLDMTEIKLTFLGISTGASGIKVKLPTHAGYTLVDIEAGAASVNLAVPEGVAARIRMEHGASSVQIDEKRFPRLNSMSGLFQSEGFDTAADKVEINLEGGASSMVVC